MTAPTKDSTPQIDASHIVARPFEGQDDYWKVRALLIETYPITPVDFNWEIRRLDGSRYHNEDPELFAAWAQTIGLWETTDGHLVGAAHHEGLGNAFLQIHPDYRHLIEAEMIDWTEAHLTAPEGDDGQRRLDFFVFDYDGPRQRLLAGRGYEKKPWFGRSRRLRFGNRPLPVPVVANGYVMRALRPGDDSEGDRMAALLNAAFNRTIHTGAEYRTFMAHSPSFEYDLHLVAEAPDGSFAAHVGMTVEDVNHYGIFEPVCTHPDHQRKGLAQALMFEGLHRFKARGATDVYVGSGDAVAANALYDSIGFTEAYKGHVWRKLFD